MTIQKKYFQAKIEKLHWIILKIQKKKLMEVKKRAKEGLNYYEKLEKMLKKSNVTDAQLQKVLKKIRKVNNYMEQDYMAETVMDSLLGIESTLRPNIYREQDEQKKELLDVAEQGKVMLYGITIAAEEIKTIAEDTIVAYAKQKKADEENARN